MSIERMQRTLREMEPALKRQIPQTAPNPEGLFDNPREQFLSALGTMASYHKKRLKDPNYRETVSNAIEALHPERAVIAEAPDGTIQAAYRQMLDEEREGALVRGLNAVSTQTFQAARKTRHHRVPEYVHSGRGQQQ